MTTDDHLLGLIIMTLLVIFRGSAIDIYLLDGGLVISADVRAWG
jgi:hypothetical protein